MPSGSSWVLSPGGPAEYVFRAVLVSLAGIGLLLSFILLRRAYRHRYFQRFNAHTLFFREHWEDLLNGAIPALTWLSNSMDREIVETLVLGRLDYVEPSEGFRLTQFLRASGLLDHRLSEARKRRGWKRRNALLSLGRMRVPEVIPILSEALDDPSQETCLAAIRSLGRTGLPAAAPPIIEYMVRGLQDITATSAMSALLRCCRSCPAILLPYISQTSDAIRPLLVRVLGEISSPDIGEDDLVALTWDNLAEVRASAARCLGSSRSIVALNALASLAADPDWFVRLRAVAALGKMGDPRAIPFLVAALCDENRLVRLRTAEVLSQFDGQLQQILRSIIQTRDEYALQAFISQVERMGAIPKLIDSLSDPEKADAAQDFLADLLQSGAHRMLLDELTHHPQQQVRNALANLLADSKDELLLPQLEALLAEEQSREQRETLEWTARNLQNRLQATK